MKTYIYYHIAQMGDWHHVVAQQLYLLQRSGLYDFVANVFVGLVGPGGIEKVTVELSDKAVFACVDKNLTKAELPTLDILHKHAQSEDFNVLYMHTKGVSWQEQGKSHESMTAWRKYMEHFCIGQWPECLAWLGTEHDAVGVQWHSMSKDTGHNGHFSGNFWWTTSRYLRTLPNIHDVRVQSGDPERMKAEMWLGSNHGIRPKCLYTYPHNLYLNPIKSSDYS